MSWPVSSAQGVLASNPNTVTCESSWATGWAEGEDGSWIGDPVHCATALEGFPASREALHQTPDPGSQVLRSTLDSLAKGPLLPGDPTSSDEQKRRRYEDFPSWLHLGLVSRISYLSDLC